MPSPAGAYHPHPNERPPDDETTMGNHGGWTPGRGEAPRLHGEAGGRRGRLRTTSRRVQPACRVAAALTDLGILPFPLSSRSQFLGPDAPMAATNPLGAFDINIVPTLYSEMTTMYSKLVLLLLKITSGMATLKIFWLPDLS